MEQETLVAVVGRVGHGLVIERSPGAERGILGIDLHLDPCIELLIDGPNKPKVAGVGACDLRTEFDPASAASERSSRNAGGIEPVRVALENRIEPNR